MARRRKPDEPFKNIFRQLSISLKRFEQGKGFGAAVDKLWARFWRSIEKAFRDYNKIGRLKSQKYYLPPVVKPPAPAPAPAPAPKGDEDIKDARALLLPSPETLRSFRKHTEETSKLSEYWFCPDLSREDQIKPIYGWAGGRPPAGIIEDESPRFDVSWDYLKATSWEQLLGTAPLLGGLTSAMQSDSPFLRVLTLGEAYLMSDTYIAAPAQAAVVRPLWEQAFAANIAQHPQVAIEAAPTSEWTAKLLGKFRCPLEFLEPEPRVRRIVDADGKLRCLIVGFAIHAEHPKQLPGSGEPGTIVHSVAATDEDPAGLEMLELFLVQYRLLYKRYVEPSRGQLTFLTPQSAYSFIRAREWSELDVHRLPSECPDEVSEDELTQSYTELMLRAQLRPVAKQPAL